MASVSPTSDDMTPEEFDAAARFTFLVRGTVEEQPVYAYVAILPSRVEAYLEAAEAGGKINFSEYGEIILCGEGEDPPADVRKRMEEEYNVNHSFEEEVEKQIREWAANQEQEADEKA